MDSVTLVQPDDWHLHLRDGAALNSVVADSASQFGRAAIMPNLNPPVTTVRQAIEYKERIISCLPQGSSFDPMMTLYLTRETHSSEISEAAASRDIIGAKLYPAGATTNSDSGIQHVESVYPLFEEMEKYDLPLLIHGEVTDPDVDVFDREQVFLDRHLRHIADKFQGLRIVLEHVTTKEGVDFIRSNRPGIAGTITAHHLLLNRNALLVGGIHPHVYCLPVLKREKHRASLLEAATSRDSRFFLGTDSAPHPRGRKESACGCAGCYTARNAMALYAMAFDSVHALDALESFASLHGPQFYKLPLNTGKIHLKREVTLVPEYLPHGDDTLIPFLAGQRLSWSIESPPS